MKNKITSKPKRTAKPFKLGLDIHGCINVMPKFFSWLSILAFTNGDEVHIITGKHVHDGVKEELEKFNIYYTHLFSISDYYKEHGVNIKYDKNNEPWIPKDLWNKAKAEYCKREKIDMHIDDSEEYGKHFETPYAKLSVKNKKK